MEPKKVLLSRLEPSVPPCSHIPLHHSSPEVKLDKPKALPTALRGGKSSPEGILGENKPVWDQGTDQTSAESDPTTLHPFPQQEGPAEAPTQTNSAAALPPSPLPHPKTSFLFPTPYWGGLGGCWSFFTYYCCYYYY